MSGCGDSCSCEKRAETWKSTDGRWLCQAKHCTHWVSGGGCKLGKVSVTCDNNLCKWNQSIAPGVYGCKCMDLHLNADGTCLGFHTREDSHE